MAVLAVSSEAWAQSAPPNMVISAEGQVAAVPDMATISAGVTTEAKTAAAALRANSEQVAAVLAELKATGVEPRDMQTSGLNLSPVWDNRSYDNGRTPVISGYQVSNMVTVRVRDLPALGAILDRVVTSGANQLNGVSFGLSDPGPLEDQARQAAVAEALRKAALYAAAAGVDLGPILSIQENGGYQEPRPMMRMAAESMPVPVVEGEVGVTAGVTITFGLR